MSDIQEIDQKVQPIAEGWVGNLTPVQQKALVEMWQSYFDICDRARGNATKGSGFKLDNTGKDVKKSGIPEDDAAKDAAKKISEQQGMNDLLNTYGSEALRDSWWNFIRGDNPDGIMLKFIRARKGDVSRSLAMMATMLRWRLDNEVELLIQKGDLVNGAEIPKFIEQQKSGKVFSLGSTGLDEPICYVIMKYHSLWGQPAESMQRFIVTQMETFRLLMADPVDKACIFFDLKGFGIKQMDIVSLLYLVKALESYYPESLAKMYVSNAPYIFWGFWRIVKNLLDPVVRNKIVFITGPAETGDHVPANRMITYCGGEVKNSFVFVDPVAGENDIQLDTDTKAKLLARHRKLTDQFEKITRQWCKVGGEDKVLAEKRQVLIKKLRLSQFILDPYTRGKTAYHRNGCIPAKSPGIAVFDYQIDGVVTRQVVGKATCEKSVEQELCSIIDGHTTVEAHAKTQAAIADGSWGQWLVNDNSAQMKEKAIASLSDVEGNQVGATSKASETTPADVAVAAPTAQKSTNGAAVATTNGTREASSAAPTNGIRNAPSAPANGNASAPVSKARPVPKQMTASPSAKRTSGSNRTASTDYSSEPKDPSAKKGILGSIKSKLAA